jgi:hypothetical protein
MGMWIQNIGVRAASLPPALARRLAAHDLTLPDAVPGWTWSSLKGDIEGVDYLDFTALDKLVARAARESGSAALGFSVHDSDSAYISGADTTGVRFRLVVNAERLDEELGTAPDGRDSAADTAAWAREYAPLAPNAAAIAEIVDAEYAFAEEGLDALLAGMGLVRAQAAEPVDGVGADEVSERDLPGREGSLSWADIARSADLEPLDYSTWFLFGVRRWNRLGAHDGAVWFALTAAGGASREDSCHLWVFAPDRGVVYFGPFASLADASELLQWIAPHLEWQRVPDAVPRDLPTTAAWIAEQSAPS